MKKLYLYGNLKMNKSKDEMIQYLCDLKNINVPKNIEVCVFVPFVHVALAEQYLKDTKIKYGVQNISEYESGAYTGEISADMALSYGVKEVIIGHSERRHIFKETNEDVARKLQFALSKGLKVVLCYGETLDERNAGMAKQKCHEQLKSALTNVNSEDLKNIIFAYEPVWAIGTGVVATKSEAREIIADSKEYIASICGTKDIVIQYGGSVKPNNCVELMGVPEIDGALIGGACLNVDNYNEIINADYLN